MSKYDKEYCEKNIKFLYKCIVYCIIAMISSIVGVRYFGAIGETYYWIMIAVAWLFLLGAVLEIGKCKNILKELEKEEDEEETDWLHKDGK
jgi:hypothetical protein